MVLCGDDLQRDMAINHASLGRRGLGNHVAKYWLLIGLGPGLSYLPYYHGVQLKQRAP